jgi:hypothetical protein
LVAKLRDSSSPGDAGVIEYLSAITELANRDPAAALKYYSTPETMDQSYGFVEVAMIAAEKDSQFFVNWILQTLPTCPATVSPLYYAQASACLAKSNPEMAVQLLHTPNLKADQVSGMVQAVFFQYGLVNPSSAESAAFANLKGKDLQNALASIVRSSAQTDPQNGLRIAEKIADASVRSNAVARVFESWMVNEPSKAMESLKSLNLKDREGLLATDPLQPGSLVASLATQNPNLLIGMLEEIIPTPANKGVYLAAIHATVLDHPSETFDLIAGMPDGRMKEQLFEAAYSSMATSNTNIALDSARKLEDPLFRSRALAAIAPKLGSEGLSATLQAAESLDSKEREVFLTTAFSSIAGNDLDAAADYLAKLDQAPIKLNDSSRAQIIGNVGERLAKSDVPSAQDWLQRLPAKDQPSAMAGIATTMAKKDIQGLAVMLSSHPQNESWAQGVRVLVSALKESDIKMADQWKSTLNKSGFK